MNRPPNSKVNLDRAIQRLYGTGARFVEYRSIIANHIGKKRPEGVFVMPDDPTGILAKLPTDEVWGVGRRLPVKLRAERILTAKDLRDAPDDVVRSVGGVTLLRTATELRGIPCNQDKDYNAKLGKGKVFSAAEGVGKPAWAMKRSKLSKRATTNWDELLTVR